jgi:type IV secretion system protein VirB4
MGNFHLQKNPMGNARTLKQEIDASKHINIVGHLDEETLIDKDGHFIRLFELQGIDPVTQAPLMLDIFKHRRNSLFKTFSSNVALYTWVIRKKTQAFPGGTFKEPFAQAVNAHYESQIKQRSFFQNHLYLALVTKPPMGKINQVSHFLKRLSFSQDKAAKSVYEQKILGELNQLSQKLLSSLRDYQIHALKVKPHSDGYSFSRPLSLMDYLINGDDFRVPLLKEDASHLLPRKRLFFNAKGGSVEIRNPDHTKKFAAVLSLKNYCHRTQAGMLDATMQLPIECILTQSFLFFDQIQAKTKVKDQEKDFEQTRDDAFSQQEQLIDTLDERDLPASLRAFYLKNFYAKATNPFF